MAYPKLVEHRGISFRGHLSKKYNMVVYRPVNPFSLYHNERSILGMLALGPGWQDADRTWTAQDIFWEDKYDEAVEQGGALQYFITDLESGEVREVSKKERDAYDRMIKATMPKAKGKVIGKVIICGTKGIV